MLTNLHKSCYDEVLLVVLLDKTFIITLIQAKVFGDCNERISLGFSWASGILVNKMMNSCYV